MKVLYYDCFSGISGDMNLSALIDLGVDPDYLETELKKLHLTGYRMKTSAPSIWFCQALIVEWARLYRAHAEQSFTRIHISINAIAAPIQRIKALFHITVKGRKRPFTNLVTMPMLDWVVMNVIHVSGKIVFITNLMLPIPTLP